MQVASLAGYSLMLTGWFTIWLTDPLVYGRMAKGLIVVVGYFVAAISLAGCLARVAGCLGSSLPLVAGWLCGWLGVGG